MDEELRPTMKPALIRGPYTPEELANIEQHKDGIQEETERDSVMVKITRLENTAGDTFTLEYGDGTTYRIDEWTAVWLTELMQSALKIRM